MNWEKLVIILSVALAITLTFLTYFIIISANISSMLRHGDLNIYTKGDVFDTKLHDLLQEHTFLLIDALRRSSSSSSSFNYSYVALQTNINEIAAQLSMVYGPDAANQFVTLWNTKTQIFINYTNALKNNDSNANAEFNSSIASYENQITQFWTSTTNPYPVLDYSTASKLTSDHVNDIKAAIDYWDEGDYSDYFVKLHDSYVQMGVYADTVAQAIINQHPEIFS